MGSYSWVRDTKRSTGGKSVVTGVAAVLPQQQPKKRKLVWQRDANAAQNGGQAAQPSNAEGAPQQEQAQVNPPQPSNDVGLDAGNKAGEKKPQHAAPAASKQKPATAAKREELHAKQKELEELQRKIEAKKKELEESAAASKRIKVDHLEKQRQEEQQREDRRRKLEAAFSDVFAEAKKSAEAEIAASRQPISFANEAEIERVLSAPTDYAVLRLQPGAAAAEVRKRYREMAVTLHPDKCTVPKAGEAFHRLVTAYQQLQKYAK